MSIKRSNPKSSSRSRSSDKFGPLFSKPVEKERSWKEWVGNQPEESFVPYSLKTHFAQGTLIAHPKFGKGAVVSVEGTLVVVLFADGPKKLGHAPG